MRGDNLRRRKSSQESPSTDLKEIQGPENLTSGKIILNLERKMKKEVDFDRGQKTGMSTGRNCEIKRSGSTQIRATTENISVEES
jgi:hypothetical protein